MDRCVGPSVGAMVVGTPCVLTVEFSMGKESSVVAADALPIAAFPVVLAVVVVVVLEGAEQGGMLVLVVGGIWVTGGRVCSSTRMATGSVSWQMTEFGGRLLMNLLLVLFPYAFLRRIS